MAISLGIYPTFSDKPNGGTGNLVGPSQVAGMKCGLYGAVLCRHKDSTGVTCATLKSSRLGKLTQGNHIVFRSMCAAVINALTLRWVNQSWSYADIYISSHLQLKGSMWRIHDGRSTQHGRIAGPTADKPIPHIPKRSMTSWAADPAVLWSRCRWWAMAPCMTLRYNWPLLTRRRSSLGWPPIFFGSRMKEWIEWAWIDRTSSYTQPHFLPWQLCCPWHSMTSKPQISCTGFGIFPAQAKHIPSKGECVKVIGQAYADRPTGAEDKHINIINLCIWVCPKIVYPMTQWFCWSLSY